MTIKRLVVPTGATGVFQAGRMIPMIAHGVIGRECVQLHKLVGWIVDRAGADVSAMGVVADNVEVSFAFVKPLAK